MLLSTGIVSLVAALTTAIGLLAGPPDQLRPTEPATGWTWPLLPQPAVVHEFGPPQHRWEPGHRGVDLAAAVGQPVVAPAPGVVTFSGPLAGRGVVVITHPNGLRSTFEPVGGALAVGEAVEPREVIGHLADTPTHCAPAVCLHWGVLRGRVYLDPLGLIGRPQIVLLPLG